MASTQGGHITKKESFKTKCLVGYGGCFKRQTMRVQSRSYFNYCDSVVKSQGVVVVAFLRLLVGSSNLKSSRSTSVELIVGGLVTRGTKRSAVQKKTRQSEAFLSSAPGGGNNLTVPFVGDRKEIQQVPRNSGSL